METTIRWAKTTDLESLLKIDRLAHQEFPDWWDCLEAEEMKRQVGKSKFNLLVGVVDGEIAGFLRGSLSGESRLTVDDIFVLKELRSQGLGKQMMNVFLKKYEGKAISVGLHTKDFNVEKFEKMGFETKMNFMYRKL
jgi:GNAT superfamily N-acetyltransferase